MATSIRFPADIRVPDRSGYGDTFEEIRSQVDMETGPPRRRNRMRVAPRLFDLQWTLDQDDYSVFESWWQDTIKGGEREFDIQLLDDDQTLVWYTVSVVGEFKSEVVNEMEWRVTMRVRAKGANFGTTRPSGTDELRGSASVGVDHASGAILVYTPFRARTAIGLSAGTARFSLPPLAGATAVGMFRLPRAKFGPFPLRAGITIGATATGWIYIAIVNFYPELSRQWMNLDWIGGLAAEDINTEASCPSREWMGI